VTHTQVYDALRHFADSYALVVMTASFVALCAWPFRPGGRKVNDAAANMIFEEDDNVR
jgi:cytochrome c oxidase cbb3-type subunit 4